MSVKIAGLMTMKIDTWRPYPLRLYGRCGDNMRVNTGYLRNIDRLRYRVYPIPASKPHALSNGAELGWLGGRAAIITTRSEISAVEIAERWAR